MRWKVLRNLVAADGRRVVRDGFLAWMLMVPVAMALALRALTDPIRGALGEAGGAERWLGIIEAAFFAVVIPLVVGTLLGFMLLDEKDDRTLTAIRVTPVSVTGYLAWRAVVAWLLSMIMIMLALPIAGLTRIDVVDTIFTAVAGAPLAAAFGLVLAAGAANKVQGFAVVKLALVVLLLPCVGLITGGFWAWATVWLPSWWPVMAHHHAGDGPTWGYVAGSYLVNIVLGVVAVRHLSARGRWSR